MPLAAPDLFGRALDELGVDACDLGDALDRVVLDRLAQGVNADRVFRCERRERRERSERRAREVARRARSGGWSGKGGRTDEVAVVELVVVEQDLEDAVEEAQVGPDARWEVDPAVLDGGVPDRRAARVGDDEEGLQEGASQHEAVEGEVRARERGSERRTGFGPARRSRMRDQRTVCVAAMLCPTMKSVSQ